MPSQEVPYIGQAQPCRKADVKSMKLFNYASSFSRYLASRTEEQYFVMTHIWCIFWRRQKKLGKPNWGRVTERVKINKTENIGLETYKTYDKTRISIKKAALISITQYCATRGLSIPEHTGTYNVVDFYLAFKSKLKKC